MNRTHADLARNRLFLRDEELLEGLDMLHAAQRRLQAAIEHVLVAHDLTAQQLAIMQAIARAPVANMGDLVSHLYSTKQTVSRAVRGLSERGLVEQHADPQDRRARLLALTSEGRERLEEMERAQLVLMRRAYRLAGAEAVDGYRRILDLLENEQAAVDVSDALVS
ncbi:MAG: MarR family winged helix-turn-helix transcriptional regulator [Geminicoccaceae bacterium]